MIHTPSPSFTSKAVKAMLCCLVLLCIGACSNVEKFIRGDERILSSNQFLVEMPDGKEQPAEIKEALKDVRRYARQKPNTRPLGLLPRISMHIYCLSNPADSNWLNRYLRRQGQAPVIYDEFATMQTAEQIKELLESKGCFRSSVSFDTTHLRKHDVKVAYHIVPEPRYRIDTVTFHAATPAVEKLLRNWQNECLIKSGDYYDQDVLDAERSQLVERLRNQGYYYASPELVSYLVDTAFEDHRLTIRLNVRNPRFADSTRQLSSRPLQQYRIDNIYIYPNTSASSNGVIGHFDTVYDDYSFRNRTTRYQFLYNQPMAINPHVIGRSLFLFQGQLYRPRSIERTYSSLLSLRNFKYINLEFSESPNSSDTNRLLNAKVRLLNAKRQRLSASVEINNSSPFGEQYEGLMSGNFGLETKLSYQNKNLFGGAELFKAEYSLLIELPKLAFRHNDNNLRENVSSFENGLDLSIDLPTFLFPFTGNILWHRMRPHTVFTLGANYQYRNYFERILFNSSFGYSWSHDQHAHQLLPLEMTFVRFFNIDSTFRSRMESLSDARVKYQYSDHFIMDARYDYVYNTQVYNTRTNFNYIHLSVETAGNLLYAVSSLTKGATDDNGIRQTFGVPFSQYVRFNAEYKHYFYLGERSTFVTRFMLGAGLPYANSSVMPFEKSFYGGGPTTIRAWHLRHLGPGNYRNSDNSLLERVGDIQLVANLEYRFPVVSIIEGALFSDFGNVWLFNESDEFPDGNFRFRDLHKSIACGIGLGIRANISILTLRCDIAIPLYDPGTDPDKHWRIPYWKFNQLTFNFGIDYPF